MMTRRSCAISFRISIICTLMPECVSIFILPPSMKVLEKRLRGRGTEDEETIQKR
ncbi:MAG TPA: hypothetical protein IAA66_00580, partial [Candidatus Avichristensenella intestinipullorum]|nr:hypothetical protein [Candidatus Avichristensenella intestinipullorum]